MALTEEVRHLKSRLGEVQDRIAAAARRASRDPGEIRLIAVTKGHPPAVIRQAYQLGLRQFGENRAFEALEKQPQLADLDAISWHMIGPVQSRKAPYLPGAFVMVHSVDRIKLAGLLSRHASEMGLALPVLLQVNVSGEESKSGWILTNPQRWPEFIPTVERLLQLPALSIQGLMTMAPWNAEADLLHRVFSRMNELKEYLGDRLGARWPELSMGMTDDFEIAIEHGATLVRIGRAIFGERD
jgi:PLP dependent protein